MTSQNVHGKSVFLEVLTQVNQCTVVVGMCVPSKNYIVALQNQGKWLPTPYTLHPPNSPTLPELRSWNQAEPSKNQPENVTKNCGFVKTAVSGSEWNQVEPSRNQANVL